MDEYDQYRQELREFVRRQSKSASFMKLSKKSGLDDRALRDFVNLDRAGKNFINKFSGYFLDGKEHKPGLLYEEFADDFRLLVESALFHKISLHEIETSSRRLGITPRKFLEQRNSDSFCGGPNDNEDAFDEVKLHSNIAIADIGYLENVGSKTSEVSVLLNQVFTPRVLEKDILETFHSAPERPLIVVGDAGFGKSTLLWKLVQTLEEHEQHEVFLIKATMLLDLPLEEVASKFSTSDKTLIYLIDTVDILLSEESVREQVLGIIERLWTLGSSLIISSRPQEAQQLNSLKEKIDFHKFYLEEFDDITELPIAIQKYAKVYCEFTEFKDPIELQTELVNATSKSLPLLGLCKNPLTLRMLFSIYSPKSIPSEISTFRLYRDFWIKRVETDTRPGTSLNQTEGNLTLLACLIAIKMLEIGRPEIRRSSLLLAVGKTHIPLSDIDSLHSRNVIKVSQDGSISFFHQTFFEHTAAHSFSMLKSSDGIKVLKERLTLPGIGENDSRDFFLLPIFVQLLLLIERVSPKKVIQALRELLNSSVFADIDSGISIYAQLGPILSDSRIQSEFHSRLKIWDTEHIIFYINIAASISSARIDSLFEDLKIILNRNKEKEWVHLITLLERFADNNPAYVKEIFGVPEFVETFHQFKPKNNYIKHHVGRTVHKPIVHEVISAIAKIADHDKGWSYSFLLTLMSQFEDPTVHIKSLSIISGKALFQEPNFNIEQIENTISPHHQGKMEGGLNRRILQELAPLWIYTWENEDTSIESILVNLKPSLNQFNYETQLYALSIYSLSLNRENAQLLINYWLNMKEFEIIFRWSRIFISSVLASYNLQYDQPFALLLISHLRETITQASKNQKISTFTKAYLHGIDISKISESRLIDLFDTSDFELQKVWRRLSQINSERYITLKLIVNLFYNDHEKAGDCVVKMIENRDEYSEEIIRKLALYLQYHDFSHKSHYVNFLYELLIDLKDLKAITKHLERYLGRGKAMDDSIYAAETSIPDGIKLIAPKINVLFQEELMEGTTERMVSAIKLWHILIELNLTEFPSEEVFSYYFNKFDSPPILIELIEIVNLSFNKTPLDHTVKLKIKTLCDHTNPRLKLVSQIQFLRFIGTESLNEIDIQTILDVSLIDLDLSKDIKKIQGSAKFLEDISKSNTDLAFTYLWKYIFSKEIMSLPSKQCKRIKNIFRRALLVFFRRTDSKKCFTLLKEVCINSDEEIAILFINSFFYFDELTSEFSSDINEFSNSDKISAKLKRVFDNQLNHKMRTKGTEVWPEVSKIFEGTFDY